MRQAAAPPLLALLGVLTVACAGEPPAPAPADTGVPLEIPLRALPGGGLAVTVQISGAPQDLLFDVGAGLTLLTPDRARELGCQPWGRIALSDVAGGRHELQRCGDLALSLGSLALSAPAAVLDEASPELVTAGLGGIASLQTLGARAVTLDLGGRRLVLESEASLAQRAAGMRPIEVRVGREAGGIAVRLYLAVGTPRGPLWMLAGSPREDRVALAPHTLALLGIPTETVPGSALEVSLDLPGLGRLDRPAVVADGPWDGVLDAETLAQLVLSVDLRDGRAWASRPPAPPG